MRTVLTEAKYPCLICVLRYLIPYEGHTYEVDEFYGDNEGLVMAEVELKHSDEALNGFARICLL